MWFYWVVHKGKHRYHLFSIHQEGKYFFYLGIDGRKAREISQRKFAKLRMKFYHNAEQIQDFSESDIYM